MQLKSMRRDVKASEAGVWINKAYGDMDVLIAAANNRKYQDHIQQLVKPYQRTIKSMSNSWFETTIQNPAVARHILLGWRNLKDDEGNEIPYSEAKALEFLNDPELVDFRTLVLSLSEESEVFRKEALEGLATKSQ